MSRHGARQRCLWKRISQDNEAVVILWKRKKKNAWSLAVMFSAILSSVFFLRDPSTLSPGANEATETSYELD